MRPPLEFFKDPNHPRLQEKDPELELELPGWTQMRKEANEATVKRWAKKREQILTFGDGYEHILHFKITSSVDNCNYEAPAQALLKEFPAIKRMCLNQYITELKDKEREAVQKARIFRDRCEDLAIAVKKVEHEAIRREFRIRQFWRNSISEGTGSRGGRMLRESLKKCGRL